MAKSTPGIDVRHRRYCPVVRDRDARCKCSPSYQAHVWSARDHKRIRKTFRSLDEARAWRTETLVGLRRGTMRAPSATTLRDVWETWLAGARDETIRNRSGDPYKPSALRGYETSLRLRVLPDLGGAKLTEISRLDVQELVDRLLGERTRREHDPQHAHAAPCASTAARSHAARSPSTRSAEFELPAVRGRRDRIASPNEAAALIAAVREEDRAVWATAFYAGLRLGELLALRDGDVDLEAGVIRVERSWDPHAGVIEPKSRAGRRSVPVIAALRPHLAARKLRRRSARSSSSATADVRSTATRWSTGLTGHGRKPSSPRSACTSADTRSPRS